MAVLLDMEASMKYNFVRFICKLGTRNLGNIVSLKEKCLFVSVEATKYLLQKNIITADLEYDIKNKLIKIVEGTHKLSKNYKSSYISTKLSTVMPKGRYRHLEDLVYKFDETF